MENYTSKGNFFIIFDTFHPPFFREKNNFQKRGNDFSRKYSPLTERLLKHKKGMEGITGN